MEDKTFKALMVALLVLPIGIFLKGALDDAMKEAAEAANPQVRWTDRNRWE